MKVLSAVLIIAGLIWIAYAGIENAMALKQFSLLAFKDWTVLVGFVPILIGVGLMFWW